MKLTVLGGGGVRAPFLAKSIITNAKIANIDEVVFMDNNEEKLNIFGKLSKKISNTINNNIKFSYTTNAREALTDTDIIITAMRVGEDESRVFDERSCLNLGLLGQETTGAAGFAMAMRSISALQAYLLIADEVSHKNYFVFNFTNPSGIVTQTLRDLGYDNVYGICDGPSEFIKQLQRLYAVDANDFSIKCYGLNHLSFFKDMKVKNKDVTSSFLNDPDLYMNSDMRIFSHELVRLMGNCLFNEYLQYYFYEDVKIENILKSLETRGELIERVNKQMMTALKSVDIDKDFSKAFSIFMHYYLIRENSYGNIESGLDRIEHTDEKTFQQFIDEEDQGGYAGVALNFIKAYVSGTPVEMVLSIPNNGALSFLDDEDIVEITCHVSKDKCESVKIEDVPFMQKELLVRMKNYEKMASKAIREKNRDVAIKALMLNPLVNTYSKASKLADLFIDKYEIYTGPWK
jgi:6-phospho-beta-glucosidase